VTVNTHGSGKIWDATVTPSCLQEKAGQRFVPSRVWTAEPQKGQKRLEG